MMKFTCFFCDVPTKRTVYMHAPYTSLLVCTECMKKINRLDAYPAGLPVTRCTTPSGKMRLHNNQSTYHVVQVWNRNEARYKKGRKLPAVSFKEG